MKKVEKVESVRKTDTNVSRRYIKHKNEVESLEALLEAAKNNLDACETIIKAEMKSKEIRAYASDGYEFVLTKKEVTVIKDTARALKFVQTSLPVALRESIDKKTLDHYIQHEGFKIPGVVEETRDYLRVKSQKK